MGFLFIFHLFNTVFLVTPLLVSSRSLHSQTPKTTVLDVATSIENTKSLFSSKTTPFSQHLSDVGTSAKLTLQLHSRTSIQRASHNDYKELTLAQLERDSSRVNFLITRLDRARDVSQVSGFEFRQEDLTSPVVSGTSQGSGEYFSRVGIGSPPSQTYVVLDTGSDVSWVQCSPCGNCYQQTDPIFDPVTSSSFSKISCGAKQCRSLDESQCRNDTCYYQVSYGDGSFTDGEFVTETVTFGSASVDDVAIGCGHNNEGLFVGAAGLLGLGGGQLSFPKQINATSFSYCLVDRDSDSASTLEFDSVIATNGVSAPLLRNRQIDTFYYLGISGVSVGGELLSIPDSAFKIDASGNGGMIVDSGTAITRLQTEAYDSLRKAFLDGTKNLPLTNGVALFDTCYDLSTRSSVEVPTVSFRFPDGRELQLPAKNYLVPVDSEGTFCLAFAPTDSNLSILGNVQQQGTRVSFDLVKNVVSFEANKC